MQSASLFIEKAIRMRMNINERIFFMNANH